MYSFEKEFGIKTLSAPFDKSTVIYKDIRICVLTESLIRIEKQTDGKFCDYPTQTVLNRQLDRVNFTKETDKNNIIIKTEAAEFTVSVKNGDIKKVKLPDGRIVKNFKKGNLGGTRRTLDRTSGKVPVGDGIISLSGAALMDDSNTLILNEDGTVKPREEMLSRDKNGRDYYCFAYGTQYKKAIADFYRLTGATPLVPRFALGNWWSRYHAYSDKEYLELMDRFTEKEIPVTVATVDMDWHWVDVRKKFGEQGGGWTGYSWNTELFPDYKKFLNELHEKNLKVTLNLHPAMGIRFFEDQYKPFAEFMGIDPESHKTIKFDITDKKFIEGYFRFLHHGYEEDGVDFWWIDWQQGNTTKIQGLDPLWALNHYHSLDKARDGERPLLLSRFAGKGSHRYPLGFSGDTGIYWSTLQFQPYFTAVSSNIGYTWWSHDIGGHYFGIRSDELYLRWLQLGVFSPILRLHSTNNNFSGKEPWKFSSDTESNAIKALRLRHRLIPYIYTMNHLTHSEGLPLVKPMYYDYPCEREAYAVPNEFLFGTELIAAPITEKCSKTLRMASAQVWLPEGRYTDIFTGRVYRGGRKIRMFRDMNSIPVLAKEGAIIPLSLNGKQNDWKNPAQMELLIFRGQGEFVLYEDDGETLRYKDGAFASTKFMISEDGDAVNFIINAAEGDISVLPENRSYKLAFRDISGAGKITVMRNGISEETEVGKENGYLCLYINDSKADEKIEVRLTGLEKYKNPPAKELRIELVSKLQGSNDKKEVLYSSCLKNDFRADTVKNREMRNAFEEIENME